MMTMAIHTTSNTFLVAYASPMNNATALHSSPFCHTFPSGLGHQVTPDGTQDTAGSDTLTIDKQA